jgi:hypothetical protein
MDAKILADLRDELLEGRAIFLHELKGAPDREFAQFLTSIH